MMETDIYSRSRLAGYEPEVLFNTTALIVGVGALGQNLALDLALAGIGELEIVDFDLFEAHNATRSPLYPRGEEQERWGLEKARVVAHKLLPMMTAPNARIRYAVAPVQSLGDLPIARAQLVFSAVDNASARSYLAERCKAARRPMIEAGFHGEVFNLTVFGEGIDEPCYRCLYPEKVGAFSCTRYALQVEQARAIPAIQNTAAVSAALQAETGIQWLHGHQSLRNQRVYGNIRTMSMRTVNLEHSLQCPGFHWHVANEKPIALDITAKDSLEQLAVAVKQAIGSAQINFPDSLVMRNFCTKCNTVTNAHAPEWRWLVSPLCANCGGPFAPAEAGRIISSKTSIHTDETDEADVMQLSCREAGLFPGTLFEVWPDTSDPDQSTVYLMQIQGSIDELMEEVALSS